MPLVPGARLGPYEIVALLDRSVKGAEIRSVCVTGRR